MGRMLALNLRRVAQASSAVCASAALGSQAPGPRASVNSQGLMPLGELEQRLLGGLTG